MPVIWLDGDPLVQGGQHAELDHAAQGGLADQDGGERVLLSMSWLVSMRTDSSSSWFRRWASSMIRTGVRPRSAASPARTS
jgi:hypothetical protein